MNAERAREHLLDVIDEQIVCAESMLRTLEAENDVLLAGDAEKLYDVSAGKAQLADTLDRLETERQGLAEAFSLTRESLAGTSAGDRWSRLLEVLEQCRDKNARNGSLVKARRAQIETALKTLSTDASGAYDSSGNRHSHAVTHRLGSA